MARPYPDQNAMATDGRCVIVLYFQRLPSTMAGIFSRSTLLIMDISQILSPSRTRSRVNGESKKRVLETIAQLIAADNPALSADDLFRKLIARERLGSTGIGHGVAIPHCRMENCAAPLGTLITLQDDVDFEAIDDGKVNLVFALMVPEDAHGQHLETLAALAQAFSDPANLEKLRSATSDAELYEVARSLLSTP